MINGLSHITLIVNNLEKTAALYKDVFDAEEIYSSGNSFFSLAREKFFIIGGLWVCIMEGETLTDRTYNHISFQIKDDEFDSYIDKILYSGAEMRPERPRVEGEGRSIYFYDYDSHLFELHTGTLEERLGHYSSKKGI